MAGISVGSITMLEHVKARARYYWCQPRSVANLWKTVFLQGLV